MGKQKYFEFGSASCPSSQLISRSNNRILILPFQPTFSLDTPPSPIAKCDTRGVVLRIARRTQILLSVPSIDKPNAVRAVCVDVRRRAAPLQHRRACTVDNMTHLEAGEKLHPICRPVINAKGLERVCRALEEGRVGKVACSEIERRSGWFATPWKEHLAEPNTVRALAVGAGLDERIDVSPTGKCTERASEVAH